MDEKQYVGAIFCGKMLFGIETWGGVRKQLIDKIQLLQDKAAVLALKGSKNCENLSLRQRQNKLNWLSVNDEIT